MVRTNASNLVKQSVLGVISHPRLSLKSPYIVDPAGNAAIVPGTGGITYNITVGDSVFDWAGDHVEPGVSITAERNRDDISIGGLCILACVGNEAKVIGGSAAGSRGVVTGKHGGVEHIMVDFTSSVLDKLVIGDRIQIRAFGQGLQLKHFPDVHIMNVDPGLFRKMGISVQERMLTVPVTHVIPASCMGSGIGSRHSYSGDYDIQVSDGEIVQKYGLQSLRLGDVIAIKDADCRYGRAIRSGAISLGIISHASCLRGGHGPGVTVVMTTAEKRIIPKIERNANISRYLGIGRERTARRMPKRR